VRRVAEARWQPRLLACITALVWQGLIIAALTSGTRPGAPLARKPDAHSAISLPQQSVIQDVAILPSISPIAEPKRPLDSPDIVSASNVRAPKVAISQADEALAAGTDLAVAPPFMPAVAGDLPIRCEVHIHQDSRGQVQAIDFGACNGDQHWQRSLLDRLQQAAGLVRPKQGASVAPVKTLVFEDDSISPEILATQLMEPVPSSAERQNPSTRIAP
jgi:hypothetical protein